MNRIDITGSGRVIVGLSHPEVGHCGIGLSHCTQRNGDTHRYRNKQAFYV
jgi:hypothetical protein